MGLYTWPWFAALGSSGTPFDDTLLHTWSLAFVVHQALSDPLHLYDANMYWPHPHALAYTETLFPQALMASPVFALTGNAMLAHNLVLTASVVLAGVFAAVLAFAVTRSRGAALVAALGFAFAPFRFRHLLQLGVSSYEWFPLVLLAVLLVLRRHRRGRAAFLLFLACLAQALSSGYYAVLLAIMLVTTAVVLSPLLVRSRRGALVPALAGVLMALAVALLATRPVATLRAQTNMTRGIEGSRHWSAVPRSFIDPGEPAGWNPSRVLGSVVEPTSEPLFPGFVIGVLAIAGAAHSRHKVARRLGVSLFFAGALFAFGPALRDLPVDMPGPFALLRLLPAADMLRAPSRFGVLSLMAASLLASLGYARIERALPSTLRGGASALTLGLMIVDLAPAFAPRPVRPPPAVSHRLAALPRGPVLELPWREEQATGYYLYWSTVHWQPLVNGYGGFAPSGNFPVAAMTHNFPTRFAARVARCGGIRYVVVHDISSNEAKLRRAHDGGVPGVIRTEWFGDDVLFEVEPWDRALPCPEELPEPFRPGRDGRLR